MFFSGKKKPLAQVFRDGNSRNRFVDELMKNEDKVFNHSFDSVQSSLGKKPNLKQTQIVVRRSLKRPHDALNDSFTTADRLETKTELFLMPMSKMKSNAKLNSTVCGGKNRTEQLTTNEATIDIKPSKDHESGRELKVFVGNVGFVVKTTKSFPNINALWDVYGKVVKISMGKHRFEYIILLRNIDDSGPILQCSYFDFNETLKKFPNGSTIRMIGKLSGFNCLRTFKIGSYDKSISQSNFMRLQNVNSFVLLQNENND